MGAWYVQIRMGQVSIGVLGAKSLKTGTGWVIWTESRLLAGLSQQGRAQVIVGAVSEHALHAAASLMLEALLP